MATRTVRTLKNANDYLVPAPRFLKTTKRPTYWTIGMWLPWCFRVTSVTSAAKKTIHILSPNWLCLPSVGHLHPKNKQQQNNRIEVEDLPLEIATNLLFPSTGSLGHCNLRGPKRTWDCPPPSRCDHWAFCHSTGLGSGYLVAITRENLRIKDENLRIS